MAQKKKIYAVRSGSQTGIFYSWDDCRKAVTGYKGAEYCGFYTIEEAEAYLNGETFEAGHDIPECPPETAIAFVDGSFDVETFRYAFGCVILYPDGSRDELNGVGNNPNAVSARNVAGELMGTMTAIKKAAEKGFRKLVIYHDYEGIAAWFQRRWKANSWCAVEYVRFTEAYRRAMDISFVKVAAHTGNTLNEAVDRLAKEALGICTKKK
ncbi:MAG: reverse transcriptase-like protein [Ruminococcaceae bacterium]|nr:reverse transcriptase-like protein [Oscillospiraceae bacterium]